LTWVTTTAEWLWVDELDGAFVPFPLFELVDGVGTELEACPGVFVMVEFEFPTAEFDSDVEGGAGDLSVGLEGPTLIPTPLNTWWSTWVADGGRTDAAVSVAAPTTTPAKEPATTPTGTSLR